MRLLAISRAHNPNAGGMERLSFELFQELKKLQGLELTTLTRTGTTRAGAILFALTALPRALYLARHADVVHIGDPVLAIHGWFIKKLWRKPIAVTIHGLDVTYANPLYQWYLRAFGKFDVCIPISEHAANLLKASPIICEQTQVITPGVHDRYFDPSITRTDLVALIRKAGNYNLSSPSSILFTAGRLVKRKGHAWFIESVLPHLPHNTMYVIAGDGQERETLEKMTREVSSAAAKQSVILLGRVSDTDLKILYNTVDAFVQPNILISGDAEGFGLVLLEAALCQRPVFASHVDGMTAAIHESKNGTLLPPGNVSAWITALQKPLRPAASAREYTLHQFHWPTQAQRYKQALQKLLS